MLCSCATHSLPTVRSLPNEEGGVGPFGPIWANLGPFEIFFFPFFFFAFLKKTLYKSFLTISSFRLLGRA